MTQSPEQASSQRNDAPSREPEHQGSIWTHPYMIYIYLTAVIFGILIVAGVLALQNDWIPKR